MNDIKRTKQEEKHYLELLMQTAELQQGVIDSHLKDQIIPEGWDAIAKEPPVAQKGRVTLLVDKDVMKWFRAQGFGYHSRINRVLRVFMLSVISRELEGAYTRDWRGEPL